MNPAARALAYAGRHAGRLRRLATAKLPPLTANDRALESLRGRHAGQTAFVVGNGPSLTPADLDLLTGRLSFGSNKIHLAFGQTPWRPTYLHVADVEVARQHGPALAARADAGRKLFADCCQPMIPRGLHPGVTWLKQLPRPLLDPARKGGYFSRNLRVGVYGGSTVVHDQLQAAFFMGVREVVLLGVDFRFTTPARGGDEKKTLHGEQLIAAGEQNHFSADYRPAGEAWTWPRLDRQAAAFRAARRAYEAAGGRVVNASRSTDLGVFERAPLEACLGGRPAVAV